MKKSRVLRNWVITGVVAMIFTLAVLGLGIWFRDTANELIGHYFDSSNLSAIAWLPVFSTRFFTTTIWEFFGLLFSGQGLGNWNDTHFIVDNVVWIAVTAFVVIFFVALLAKAIKRKNGKFVGFAIFFLVFGIIAWLCTNAYYFGNHVDWHYISNGVEIDGLVDAARRPGDLTIWGAWVNALLYGWHNSAIMEKGTPAIIVTALTWVLVIAAAIYIISFFGIAITGLASIKKKEVEEVVAEEAVAPVVEAAPVQETPAPAPEKKKGILIAKRYDKYGNYGPLVEGSGVEYPAKAVKSKALTVAEVKEVIREEIEKAEARRIVEEYKAEKNAAIMANAIVKANADSVTSQPAKVSTAVEGKKDEEKVYSSPIIVAMPSVVKEVNAEKEEVKVEKTEAPKKANKGLTEEQVKDIIASEIREALKDLVIKHEKVVEKQVEVKVPAKEEPVVEETKEEVVHEEPVVTETPVVEETTIEETKPVETVKEEVPAEEVKVEETVVTEEVKEEVPETEVPTEEVKTEETPVEETKVEEVIPETPVQEEVPAEEPKVEETPVEEPAKEEPVVEAAQVVTEEKPKIVRVPFTTRMMEADDELKSAYNHIKSLLKSYGLNNRVANGGDSFRLHRVTYCKITIAGKSLKLYLALDPQDYVDSTYPIKDASSKNIYKETPLVFKVKSGLSLRRADELIRDCMDKHGLEQIDQVKEFDWASELANETIVDDGDEGDEE